MPIGGRSAWCARDRPGPVPVPAVVVRRGRRYRGFMVADAGSSAASCVRCVELQAEVERLRVELARARADKAALLRASAERDYERPPHYQ